MSLVQISVEWEKPVFYAGQDVRCKITFRSAQKRPGVLVARSSVQQQAQADSPKGRKKRSSRSQDLKTALMSSRAHSRSLSSDQVPRAFPNDTSRTLEPEGRSQPRKHKRSVSVLSTSSPSPDTWSTGGEIPKSKSSLPHWPLSID